MQVFVIFNTPYGISVTDNAKAVAARGGNTAAAPAAMQKFSGPKAELWSYDGKTPFRGPNVPEPYCTYDAAKSSAQYAAVN
jgi:hypothetical protein